MDRVLILDDDWIRHDEFKKRLIGAELTHVETSKDAIDCLTNNAYEWVFLDHDLGGQMMVPSGEETGYEVAEWLSKNTNRLPVKGILLHSLNPIGRKNMFNVLSTVNIKVYDEPGYWTYA